MPITNPVQALIKLTSEDSISGLEIREADSTGTIPASSSRAVVLASAAYIASGVSAAQTPNALYTELLLLLRVTAVANPGTLNVFVDVSDDAGTTWIQAYQLGPTNIAAVPAQVQGAYAGYILTISGNVTATGSWGDTWRIRYQIAGGGASFTFQVTAIYKKTG